MATQLYSQKEITLKDAIEHGLTQEEFEKIKEYLNGRTPTDTELGMYSAMWSEHCSYKNSILQLKTLPTDSDRALAKAGEENAGALDIGDGLAVVFKIESHNHPTAIEPYQGAATGVGGIMRDIFTMGARPICSLNSLRFGPPDEGRNRFLLDGAIKGIGDYGNCLGIPVLGGELFIDKSFSKNPLVNAMAVGVVKHDQMASATTGSQAGNPVFIVGATTGRDGIHGASFASQDLTKESESNRSAVQVGDPFMEKLLMEATLELIKSGKLIGIQDMGAAGLSCSSSEMSAKGKTGMEIDLDKVPLREDGMNAYEIMLSESQERMLVVVKRGDDSTLQKIFKKWELHAVEIGTIRDDGMLVVKRNGKVCTRIPADSLVLGGGAPKYIRQQKRPGYLDQISAVDVNEVNYFEKSDLADDFILLAGCFNICSRRPLYEQYDNEVGLARVMGPGADGGLARIIGTKKGLAVSTDCNSRYVYMNPGKGTSQAVCEAARNVAMTGSRPIGVTNCLNFGNPYLPENYYIFAQAIAGMREACIALETPVTGGNVSFYNESDQGPVYPTPTIGMVGLIDDCDHAIRPYFQKESAIYLIGDFAPSFGGSEYQNAKGKPAEGQIPGLNLDSEKNLISFMGEAAKQGLVLSARDLSIGGLSFALFRSAYNPDNQECKSFRLSDDICQSILSGRSPAQTFFAETNGCAILSIDMENQSSATKLAEKHNLEFTRIGEVTKDTDYLHFGEFKVSKKEALQSFEKGLVNVFHSVYSEKG